MAKNGLKERFMNIECVPSNHLNDLNWSYNVVIWIFMEIAKMHLCIAKKKNKWKWGIVTFIIHCKWVLAATVPQWGKIIYEWTFLFKCTLLTDYQMDDDRMRSESVFPISKAFWVLGS